MIPEARAPPRPPSPTCRRRSSSALLCVVLLLSSVARCAADPARPAVGQRNDRAAGGSYHGNGGTFGTAPLRQTETLLKKLGADFDASVMSVEKPVDVDRGQSAVTEQPPVNLKMYDDLLRHVNFTIRDEATGDEQQLKPAVRKYLERWLLQRTSCPVQLVWDDLGVLFWPRWIRRGVCGGSASESGGAPSTSCSWPPGMRCVPEASQTIRLLRWHCRQPRASSTARWSQSSSSSSQAKARSRGGSTAGGGGGSTGPATSGRSTVRPSRRGRSVGENQHAGGTGSRERMRCRWKKVPYSVTTGCFCSC